MRVDLEILKDFSVKYGRIAVVEDNFKDQLKKEGEMANETRSAILIGAGYTWDNDENSYVKNSERVYFIIRNKSYFWVWNNSLIKDISNLDIFDIWLRKGKSQEFIKEYIRRLEEEKSKKNPLKLSPKITIDANFLKSIKKTYGVFPVDTTAYSSFLNDEYKRCTRLENDIEEKLIESGYVWNPSSFAYIKNHERIYYWIDRGLIMWEWRRLMRTFYNSQIDALIKWISGDWKYPEGKANNFINLYTDHINSKGSAKTSKNKIVPDDPEDPEDPRNKEEKSKEDLLILKLVSLIRRGKENLITTDLLLDFYNECPTKEMKQKLTWFVKKFGVGGLVINEGNINIKDLVHLITEITYIAVNGIKNKKIKLNENKSSREQYIINFANKMWPTTEGEWTLSRTEPYRFGGNIYILKHLGSVPKEICIGQFGNKLYLYYTNIKTGGGWKELKSAQITETTFGDQISDTNRMSRLADEKWPSKDKSIRWHVVKVLPIKYGNTSGNKYILNRKQNSVESLMVFQVGTSLFGRNKLDNIAWGNTIKLANITPSNPLDKKQLIDLVNKEWPRTEGSGEWMLRDMKSKTSMPAYTLQRTRGIEKAEISQIGDELYYNRPSGENDVSETTTTGAVFPLTRPTAFDKKYLDEITTADGGTTGYMVPGAFSRRGGSVRGIDGSNALGYTLTTIGQQEMKRRPDPLYEQVIKTIYNKISKKKNKKC